MLILSIPLLHADERRDDCQEVALRKELRAGRDDTDSAPWIRRISHERAGLNHDLIRSIQCARGVGSVSSEMNDLDEQEEQHEYA